MKAATQSVRWEDLAVLNQELAALARAGLPLDRGLARAANDLGGRAGALGRRISERLAQGATLSQALEAEAAVVPPLYRAVVAAGERTGELAAALLRVAELSARLRALRANVGLALVYPLLVCFFAAGAWTIWSQWVFSAQREAAEDFGVPLPALLAAWQHILATVHGVVPLPVFPSLLLVAVVAWWYASGRTSLVTSRGAAKALAWVPWAGSVVRWSQQAVLAEMLLLLLEHGVPADEALPLAAEAAGGGPLADGAKQLAAQFRQGKLPRQHALASLPALDAWLLALPHGHAAALRLLRSAAQRYHRRAEARLLLARVALPCFLLICFLWPLVMAYAASVFLPTIRLIEKVGQLG
ncbi:MAG: type II secretion system F family protein [Pirellulales bacterium]|nr:type II secretion system F family protein [Pirellulales bacterium]